MKRILFFGAPVFQIPVIEKAKELGLFVGVIDINPNAIAIPYADVYYQGSLRNNEEMLSIAQKFKPDGIVVGACDTSVVSASYVCNKLGLPGHSIETAIMSTDKLHMLQAFERGGVAHPRYRHITQDEISNFEMDFGYPAISKPSDGSGSRGIAYIKDDSSLYEALRTSISASRSGNALVEEYMVGPEVSVEVLVANKHPHVLQITDKITSGPPHFFETGHSQPSLLPDPIQAEIKDLAAKACIAVGLVNSPAHVEIKITKDGPKLVEIGARLGGGCISTYLLDASLSGFCLSEAAILQSLGQEPHIDHYSNSGVCSAVRFILSKNGTIAGIRDVEKARNVDGVIKVQLMCKIGQTCCSTSDNASRLGFVVAEASTQEKALGLCEKAISMIHIDYK